MNDSDYIQQIIEDTEECKAYLRSLSSVLCGIETQIYMLCEKPLHAAPESSQGFQAEEHLIRENERLHQRIHTCHQILARIDTLLISLADEISGNDV